MSHEITDIDEMFSVRQPTWHGLGQILDDYPSRQEAQQIAHPWEPISEPLYREVPYFDESGLPQTRYEKVEGYVANSRSDNAHLLGVVSDGYVPINNSEMWDIAEVLQGENTDVKFETAGSLAGGRKVWLMLRLEEPIEIDGDPNGATVPFYALQNSHDGSGSFRGQATSLRIVCANTSHAADMDAKAKGTEFTFRHSKNIRERVEEARHALAGWRESVADWKLLNEHLLTMNVDAEGEREFLTRFIPEPMTAMTSERVKRNIDEARSEFMGVYQGETLEGVTGTAYGLVHAASEWTEHYRRARTEETRFKRAVLDRNGVLGDAVKIAREVAFA